MLDVINLGGLIKLFKLRSLVKLVKPRSLRKLGKLGKLGKLSRITGETLGKLTRIQLTLVVKVCSKNCEITVKSPVKLQFLLVEKGRRNSQKTGKLLGLWKRKNHPSGVQLRKMDKIKLWLYRWIYAPLVSWREDFKHRNDPPLPAVPCQICGRAGHKERFCPNAKALGFFDD